MLAVGDLLQDRYQIVRALGQGGMGAVYEAVDRRLGHPVAVKQILHSDPALRVAFEQEARLLAALRHPALPKVTDHFVEASGQFLVMEFIPGEELAVLALRRREPLPVQDVLHWADQLLDVLIYLHQQTPPVIHRDIKPHNLKLNAQGAVMLLDFGLAKGAPGQASDVRSLAGYTLHYAAPEQLRGEPSDPRTDLYALAATLYDLLAGERPPNALQRLTATAGGQPDPLPPLHLRNPAVSPAVSGVIQQALTLAASARFAEAAAMRLALHRAGGEATQIVASAAFVTTLAATPTPAHNLPAQLTSFVAREAEVAAVQQYLQADGVRLVTLTGPGGIGKTRLALATATRCLADYRDGVFFVSLAAISDSSLVLPTIAQTLGLRETPHTPVRQSLHESLRDKEMLLLLDNFEQIVAAASDVSDLLLAAPHLKLLVTSREALQVRGEQEYLVPVLELPDLRRLPPLDELAHCAAVRLFVQRAQAVKPNFALSADNAAAVAEICKRLDGLPLALELAAASTKILSVHAILARLAERFELPTSGLRDLPARQRTLRGLIGWSYDLLTEDEQAVFRRIAIFAGSFALDAAEAVCQATGRAEVDVLDTVAALVGKSLVRPLDPDAQEPRFTLLETIREFGLKQLAEQDEAQAVGDAHAAYYDGLVQEAERNIWGANAAVWVSRLDAELENLRAGLTHLLAQPTGAEAGLRFAGSLWRFWEIRGYIQEGRDWLDRALARREEVPPAGRWLALHGAGNLAIDQDDYALATTHYQESLRLLQGMLTTLEEPLRVLRTRYAIANTLNNLGLTALLQGQFDQATIDLQEAMAIYRELIDHSETLPFEPRIGLGLTISNLALSHLWLSRYAEAEAYSQEALTLYRKLGDERGIGWSLQRLGMVARHRGEYEQAAKLYQEAKARFEKQSNQADMAMIYLSLGELARQQGQDEQAEAEFQRGLTLARELGNRKDTARLLNARSALARRRGDYAQAATLNDEAIRLDRQIGNLFGLSDALMQRGRLALARQDTCAAAGDLAKSLRLKAQLGERRGIVDLFKAFAALILAEDGDAAVAGRLFAAAETLRLALGAAVPPVERTGDTLLLETVRAMLLPADFAAAWAEGEAMELDEAIAYALAQQDKEKS